MELKKYIETTGQVAFARLLGVSQSNIYQWIKGIRPVPIARCTQIEKATNRAVSRSDLRPNDWHLIWPELADPPHFQEQPSELKIQPPSPKDE